MSNLVFVGFIDAREEEMREKLPEILVEFPLEDFVITSLRQPRVSVTELIVEDPQHPFSRKDSPYIIVRDTEDGRMLRVGYLLNEKLNVDVEMELIDHFFSRRK